MYPSQSFINFDTFLAFIFRIYQNTKDYLLYLSHFFLSDAFTDSPWTHEKGIKVFGIVLELKAQIINLLRDDKYVIKSIVKP